ncbi:Ragulator complex protein LAMTOR1 [Bienertia sinuspersici]
MIHLLPIFISSLQFLLSSSYSATIFNYVLIPPICNPQSQFFKPNLRVSSLMDLGKKFYSQLIFKFLKFSHQINLPPLKTILQQPNKPIVSELLLSHLQGINMISATIFSIVLIVASTMDFKVLIGTICTTFNRNLKYSHYFA